MTRGRQSPYYFTCPGCGYRFEMKEGLYLTETQRRIFEYLRRKFVPTSMKELALNIYGRDNKAVRSALQTHITILRKKIEHHPYFVLTSHPYLLTRKRKPEDLAQEENRPTSTYQE